MGWYLVASGDFNGDGTSDLIWKNATSGDISDWLGSKSGGFGFAATPPATGWSLIATAISTATASRIWCGRISRPARLANG
ncbi:MAG TPA: FG-GAP repeat protein [Xanthobacteraceae bacterium]